MTANPRWSRWIHQSVADLLKTKATSLSLASLVEEVEKRETSFIEASDRVEIRFNGPFISLQGQDVYYGSVRINVLVQSDFDSNRKNRFAMTDILGEFASVMGGPIPILKCGPDVLIDTGDQIGCLHLMPGKKGVQQYHFGQVNDTDTVRHGSVTAEYFFEFEGDA